MRARDSVSSSDAGAHLGLQSFVVEREPDRRAETAFEVGWIGVMSDDRDGLTVTDERGGGGRVVRSWVSERTAIGVGEVAGARQPVVDAQARITDRSGQGDVEAADRRRLVEGGDDPARRSAAAAGRSATSPPTRRRSAPRRCNGRRTRLRSRRARDPPTAGGARRCQRRWSPLREARHREAPPSAGADLR